MSKEENCTLDVIICACNTNLSNSKHACYADLCNPLATTPTNYASGKVATNISLGMAAMVVAMLFV
jgi:hypothetical protein